MFHVQTTQDTQTLNNTIQLRFLFHIYIFLYASLQSGFYLINLFLMVFNYYQSEISSHFHLEIC